MSTSAYEDLVVKAKRASHELMKKHSIGEWCMGVNMYHRTEYCCVNGKVYRMINGMLNQVIYPNVDGFVRNFEPINEKGHEFLSRYRIHTQNISG